MKLYDASVMGGYDLLVKDASCQHEFELPRPSSPCSKKGLFTRHVTRWRACAVTAFCLMSVFFLLFSCLDTHNIRQHIFCCGHQVSSSYPSVSRLALRGKEPAYDYADYDADLEGADRIRYKHTKRRLPQCVIIGVRKGGTRALLEFLNLHPSIQAQKREMHFFDDDDNYSLGLDWYRKKMPFSFPDQITIEKTPAYFVEESAPERLYKMNKTVKLLLVVRNPSERTISDYTQIHVNRLEKNKPHDKFEELVMEDDGTIRKSYNAIRRSLYHKHMENWLKWFPLEQFHVVNGENLVRKPWEELDRVESFLGLEKKLDKDLFYFNETRGFFCVHSETFEKCLARSKGRIHPSVDPIVVEKLHEFFRPHNQIFYEQIGRDLGWP